MELDDVDVTLSRKAGENFTSKHQIQPGCIEWVS